jgi:hypothetical protein
MSTYSSEFEKGYDDGEANQRGSDPEPSQDEISLFTVDYRLGFVTGWVSAFGAGLAFKMASVAGDKAREYGLADVDKLIKELALTDAEHKKMVKDDFNYKPE